jgi:hypothetical protein
LNVRTVVSVRLCACFIDDVNFGMSFGLCLSLALLLTALTISWVS